AARVAGGGVSVERGGAGAGRHRLHPTFLSASRKWPTFLSGPAGSTNGARRPRFYIVVGTNLDPDINVGTPRRRAARSAKTGPILHTAPPRRHGVHLARHDRMSLAAAAVVALLASDPPPPHVR